MLDKRKTSKKFDRTTIAMVNARYGRDVKNIGDAYEKHSQQSKLYDHHKHWIRSYHKPPSFPVSFSLSLFLQDVSGTPQ